MKTGKRRYSVKLWKTFTDCFNCLPVAAIVAGKIFCCHGAAVMEIERQIKVAHPDVVAEAMAAAPTPKAIISARLKGIGSTRGYEEWCGPFTENSSFDVSLRKTY